MTTCQVEIHIFRNFLEYESCPSPREYPILFHRLHEAVATMGDDAVERLMDTHMMKEDRSVFIPWIPSPAAVYFYDLAEVQRAEYAELHESYTALEKLIEDASGDELVIPWLRTPALATFEPWTADLDYVVERLCIEAALVESDGSYDTLGFEIKPGAIQFCGGETVLLTVPLAEGTTWKDLVQGCHQAARMYCELEDQAPAEARLTPAPVIADSSTRKKTKKVKMWSAPKGIEQSAPSAGHESRQTEQAIHQEGAKQLKFDL